MAEALKAVATPLFGNGKTHVNLLTDAAATRERIRDAFAEVARKAQPQDVLVIYFAGHSLSLAGGDGFYFLTQEADAPGIESAETSASSLPRLGVSSQDLFEWLRVVPALKQSLILDTVNSGNPVTGKTQSRPLSTDYVRAIEQLKDRTGLHILMGSTSGTVSYSPASTAAAYSLTPYSKGCAARPRAMTNL